MLQFGQILGANFRWLLDTISLDLIMLEEDLNDETLKNAQYDNCSLIRGN